MAMTLLHRFRSRSATPAGWAWR